MFNRAADNWRPLLAIADAAGGAWPEKARKAAVALAGGEIDEVSRTELLLSDIRNIFDDLDVDEIGSAELI
jgi:putative DNA primase/helicase